MEVTVACLHLGQAETALPRRPFQTRIDDTFDRLTLGPGLSGRTFGERGAQFTERGLIATPRR